MDHSPHNHQCHGHQHGRRDAGYRLFFVIIFNLAITAAEYVGGILSGSLSLISDAGHNLSDVFSLALGYFGERFSRKKPSESFSFGMKRFEVLAALLNALTLVIIGGYIVYEAVHRLIEPETIDLSVMLPVAAIGLAGNAGSIIVLFKNRKGSLNLKAAFVHLFYDMLSSIGVIIAGLIIYFTGKYFVDIIISLLIVGMIIWSSVGIIIESGRIFMQGSPMGVDTREVLESISTVEGVRSVHGLHIWSINSNEIFLSCHICVDNLAERGTDSIISNINAMLESKYEIKHTAVQAENDLLCSLDSGDCCR
jgi:cobalt-zinc-cadmium efflux system protein